MTRKKYNSEDKVTDMGNDNTGQYGDGLFWHPRNGRDRIAFYSNGGSLALHGVPVKCLSVIMHELDTEELLVVSDGARMNIQGIPFKALNCILDILDLHELLAV